MSLCVVDASVAVKWSFPESYTDEALRLHAPSHQLCAPDFLWLEIASVVCQRIRRKLLLREKGLEIISALRRLPIQIFPSSDLLNPATAIALETSTSVYDCLYLDLAISRGAQLVTADRRFYNALAPTHFANYLLWIADLP